MAAPIAFVYGNCVFAQGLDDGWAAFAVQVSSYAWLSEEGKRARFLALIGALEAIEADVQILRVCRRWSLERYTRALREQNAVLAGDGTRAAGYERYVEEQVRRLGDVGTAQVALFLLVSLREPERDVASYVSRAAAQHPREWWAGLKRDARTARQADPERVRARAGEGSSRPRACTPRGLPAGASGPWRGAAVAGAQGLLPGARASRWSTVCTSRVRSCSSATERRVLAPLEGDVMRWADGYVEHPRPRREDRIRARHQLAGAPRDGRAAGADAVPRGALELMFAPVESLPFGVDLSLNARFLPNELALRIARRRIQDADQIVRAESDGEQGVSDLGYERTQEARDLLAYLQASSRPPLLRATLAIAVGAALEEELEARVEMCRRAYGEIRLHRPLGDQLQLFFQHLPASAPGSPATTTR